MIDASPTWGRGHLSGGGQVIVMINSAFIAGPYGYRWCVGACRFVTVGQKLRNEGLPANRGNGRLQTPWGLLRNADGVTRGERLEAGLTDRLIVDVALLTAVGKLSEMRDKTSSIPCRSMPDLARVGRVKFLTGGEKCQSRPVIEVQTGLR